MKYLKRTAVLLAVFLAAAVIYFFRPMGQEESREETVYTVMEDAVLPVVYPRMLGREMAPLFGQMEERAVTASRDSLIVLPEDRKMTVRIESGEPVSAIRYEVRSLDMEELVERTELSSWEEAENGLTAVLPIQNLLAPEREYLLGIQIQLADGTAPWYYTRIVETDGEHTMQMCALAEEFSLKTLNYENAQDLTMYMETEAGADNSSFGVVTLKNSFSQLTWGNLAVERTGAAFMKLRELSGELANIELQYYVTRMEEGQEELYAVTENFTMRWASQRIYMMDYERTMEQIFTGDESLYSGKRILLGISSGRELQSARSAGGRYTAFAVNRELWVYDQEENRNIRVFGFGDAGTEKLRENLDHHGIEILSLSDEGSLEFLVYGRMNQGEHEGYTGISYFSCDLEENVLEELFFLPAAESWEELKADMETLAYRGGSGIFYLYLDHAVYGIDLKSLETVTVASGLSDGSFAVSEDHSRIAWQENTGLYDSPYISVMDLDSGTTSRLGGEPGQASRILGFVGNDCVYGTGSQGDYIMSNGRIMGLYLTSIDIVDRNMETVMHYDGNGGFIRDADVDGSRIHIQRVSNKDGGFFGTAETDTLICNSEGFPGSADHIGWYASSLKERVYFAELPSDIPAGTAIITDAPALSKLCRSVSLEQRQTELPMEFYAYGRGQLLGRYNEFAQAAAAAYDAMGFVAAGKNDVLWVRANKPGTYSLRDPETAVRGMERIRETASGSGWTENGEFLLDASGTELAQILYFAGQGVPVLVYTGEGQYEYITGFDQVYVRVYNPITGLTETMTQETAAAEYARLGNDFLCLIPSNR